MDMPTYPPPSRAVVPDLNPQVASHHCSRVPNRTPEESFLGSKNAHHQCFPHRMSFLMMIHNHTSTLFSEKVTNPDVFASLDDVSRCVASEPKCGENDPPPPLGPI